MAITSVESGTRKRLSKRLRSVLPGRSAGLALLAHAVPSVCVLGQWSPVALRRLPGGVCLWRGPADTGQVALTFDDGPSPPSTFATLDLLDELGMRATFFVLGTEASRHGDVVVETLRRGHGIGCHGYQHQHHLLRTPGWIRRDTAKAVRTLEGLGVEPRWYRPPYGQLTTTTVIEALRHGMEIALWSAWGREWVEPDAESVMARLDPRLEPGAIVLLHDTEVSCPPGTTARTHRTLELLAGELDRRGLKAVDLDTLTGAATSARAAGVGPGLSARRRPPAGRP